MDFSECLRLIDAAIAIKNHQEVIDLCNEYFEKSSYSLLLAEKRGDARFNLKQYEEASIDFHNVLEAGIQENQTRIKLCLINSKVIADKEVLYKENYPLLRDSLNGDLSAKQSLIAIFGNELIARVEHQAQQELLTKDKQDVDVDDGSDIEFDVVMYRKFNPDLRGMTDQDLLMHYKKAGIFEKRVASKSSLRIRLNLLTKQAPQDFSVNSYKLLNPDLYKNFENIYFGPKKQLMYLEHYLSSGRREKREYQFPRKYELEQLDKNQFSNQFNYAKNLNQFLASQRKIHLAPSMFTKPIVSFVVPVYGRFDLLLNLLFSLESQIDQRFEVILHDNASPESVKEQFYSKINAKISLGEENLHYLRACNLASEQARGSILVFLNSDVELANDTVGCLIDSFDKQKNLGVLGGLVLHKDQFVQELGGVIFADGSNKGIGRGFGQEAFWLSFPRKVDYVSGCFLATSKDLFVNLGKFDEHFLPAYYEDLDYCTRVAAKGLDVIADPAIKITHHEFGSQKKVNEGLSLQVKNRKQFVTKHREYLKKKLLVEDYRESQLGEVSDFGSYAKKVLYIDDAMPDPKFGSGFGRAKDIIDTLLSLNCFITHISTSIAKNNNTQIDDEYRTEDSAIEFIKFCKFEQIASVLAHRPHFYDCVIVSRKHNMEYFLSYFKNFLGNATVIFDVEALFSVRDFIGKSELNFKEIDYDAYKKSAEFLSEIEIFKYADVIWFASQLEKLIYEKGVDNPKPAYEVGHSVHNLPTKTQAFELRQGMVFLGGVPEKTSPNADSIYLLIKEIIPGLRKSGMNEPFYIMGNIEVPEIEKDIKAYCEQDPHTHYLGFMDSPEEIIQKARVFIAPSRIAAGIPHKLTLPAQHGVPIVTSGLISQQVFTKDCFKSSNSIDEFISNIETLYRDRSHWQAASQKSRAYVNQELNPKNYEAAFLSLIK